MAAETAEPFNISRLALACGSIRSAPKKPDASALRLMTRFPPREIPPSGRKPKNFIFGHVLLHACQTIGASSAGTHGNTLAAAQTPPTTRHFFHPHRSSPFVAAPGFFRAFRLFRDSSLPLKNLSSTIFGHSPRKQLLEGYRSSDKKILRIIP